MSTTCVANTPAMFNKLCLAKKEIVNNNKSNLNWGRQHYCFGVIGHKFRNNIIVIQVV